MWLIEKNLHYQNEDFIGKISWIWSQFNRNKEQKGGGGETKNEQHLRDLWDDSKEKKREIMETSLSLSLSLCIYIYIYVCVCVKVMAPHSSSLAWKIPWTEEPGRLQPMESWRVGLDWATSLSLFTFMHWRRKWQPTPVFLPGESHGRGSLVGCRLWGHTESDTTEAT